MNLQHKDHQHENGYTNSALLDPVCGKSVTTKAEHSFLESDDILFFCSAECLDKYRIAPNSTLIPGLRRLSWSSS